MKLGSLAAARPAYYDRNAASVTVQYVGNTIAPHVDTIRNTYTVASGRKLLLELGHSALNRQVAAAPVGLFNGTIYIAAAGNTPRYCHNMSKDNTVAPADIIVQVFGNVTVYASETVNVLTADYSTGGSVNYVVMWKGTTYDA